MHNRLSENRIRENLTCSTDLRFKLYDSVTSTNTILKEFSSEDEGLVIVAEQQSEGRGRLGRTFYSPKNGLYTSILLKPNFSAEDIGMITLTAAVAVCLTIERLTDHVPKIKWVNDILIDGKKVCGILTQGTLGIDKGLEYAILGIGVNMYEPNLGFDREISDIATAIFSPFQPDRYNLFLSEMLNNFFNLYNNADWEDMSKQYQSRSIIVNKNIEVLEGTDSYRAYVVGMDERCNLLLRLEDGSPKKLFCGEVSIRI